MFCHGETSCQATVRSGGACDNKAYFLLDSSYVCGVHNAGKRGQPLRKDPNRIEAIKSLLFQNLRVEANKVAERNVAEGFTPLLGCSKLRMMKQPTTISGYLTILVHSKAKRESDGVIVGLPGLSPMALGPVHHGQPSLPPATCVENFWQGSKIYSSESMEEFRGRQCDTFMSSEPLRHNKGKKGVKPQGWVWTEQDGHTRTLSYLQARPFYCAFYERLALKSEDWDKLCDYISRGFRLLITGYDGVDSQDIRESDICALYCRGDIPFGHELVLCAMLLGVRPWVLRVDS